MTRGASTRKRSGDERGEAERQKRSTRSSSGAGAGKKAPRLPPALSSAAFTAEVTDEMKADQALALALAKFDYKSWRDLVVESVRRAGGPVVLAEKHANRNRETTREIRGGRVVLEDVVHRNGLLYDGKFAQEYRRVAKELAECREVVDAAVALEKHSKLTNVWSSLTPEEHSWYLTHRHQKLSGQDAKHMARLAKRVEKEQQAYRVEIYRAYAEDPHRFKYEYLTDRQAGQLTNDDERRQDRVRALFRSEDAARLGLVGVVDRVHDGDGRGLTSASPNSAEATGATEAVGGFGTFEFVSVLRTVGEADMLSPLDPGHDLQGYKHYLPPIGPPSDERYTKPVAPEVDEDPVVAELLRDPAVRGAMGGSNAFVLVATASVFHKLIAGDALALAPAPANLGPGGDNASQGPVIADIPITRDTRSAPDHDVWYLHKPCMPRKLMVREKQRRIQKYAVLSASCSLPPRQHKQTIYTLWRHTASGTPCIVRHRSVLELIAAETAKAAKRVLFAVKPEYLPEPDREAQTPEEKATWDAQLALAAPIGARSMQLAHVDVGKGRILSWDTYHPSVGSPAKAPKSKVSDAHSTVRCPTIGGLISWISSTPTSPGVATTPAGPSTASSSRYASVVTGTQWAIYGPGNHEANGNANGNGNANANANSLDIRAIHEHSTAVDVISRPFVPPVWRPFSDDMAQIPDTFPPRRKAPKPTRIKHTPLAGEREEGENNTATGRKTRGKARGRKAVTVPEDLDNVPGDIPGGTKDLDLDYEELL